MQNVGAIPIARDPSGLAQLYFSGLGTSWENQTEAAATLAHFNPKVSRYDLNRAIGVSQLPAPVLSLFHQTGIWNVTARKLASLAKRHGPEVLAKRATRIDPSGRTTSREITDLLDDQEPMPPKRQRRDNNAPLALAAFYHNGLAQGRWTSLDSAAAVSDVWLRSDFAKAVAISKLPPTVLQLFEGRPFPFSLGEVLVRIQKVLGPSEISARAEKTLAQPKRRTTDQIVSTLLRVMPTDGVDLKIRATKKGSDFHFHVDFDHSNELFIDATEMAPIIQLSLNNLRMNRKSRR
jgi:hypothetical protein